MKTSVVNALSADPVRQVYITLLNQTSQRGEQAVTHDREEGLEIHIPEMLHLFHEAHLLFVCVCVRVCDTFNRCQWKDPPNRNCISVTAQLTYIFCPKVSMGFQWKLTG